MSPPSMTTRTMAAAAAGVNASSAGYGRSCTNCSRAKCKCILRASGGSCERCYRLEKECQPIITSRKRVPKKPSSSRTAQLEEKFDDLLSILRASQQLGQQPGSGAMHMEGSQGDDSASPESGLSRSRMHSLDPSPAHPIAVEYAQGMPGQTSSSLHTGPEPTPAEAEIYLQTFRGWLKHFPFLIIPAETTAEQLRQDRPFLWLCIMTITTMSLPQQAVLKERVRQELSQRIIFTYQINLDLLLGLIAFLSWTTLNTGPGARPFLLAYTQLATTALFELGLARSPVEQHYFLTSFKAWCGRPPPPKERTMEERRALLTLWFLTSSYSCFVAKTEALRWTFHMQESLDILEREKEYPSDQVLVTLLKAQLVADEAHKLWVQDVMTSGSGQTPSFVFRKSMIKQIQSIREGMSVHMSESPVVQAQLYSTEILIHSVGLFMHHQHESQRVEAMYACLNAARSWYETWFSIPTHELPALPFSVFIQLSQTHVALYRLTTSDDPSWDKDVVRNTADLSVILDRCIEKLEDVDRTYGRRYIGWEQGTLYTKAVQIMRHIRSAWEPSIAKNLGGLPTPGSHPTTTSTHMEPVVALDDPSVLDPSMMDFGDINWMTDVFGPWEF